MKKLQFVLALLAVNSLAVATRADGPPLNAHLEPLRPLLGKIWKGTFEGSKSDKPTVDVGSWEVILNGQAIRRIHSVNDGAYAGESLMFWDEQHKRVGVYYVTTAGFTSIGSLEFKDGKIIHHEDIKGDADGVTEVRAVSEFLPDGRYHLKAEYRKNGQWGLGREVFYEESPTSKVVIK